MKKLVRFCSLILTLSFVLSIVASAAVTRASPFISDYEINAKACGGGQIAIDFSVFGNARMSRIGALEIIVYQKSGSSWNIKHTYDEYDTGMAVSNAPEYGNTIYYDGTVGATYMVEVTIFARNSAGEDTRSQTFSSIVVR